IAVGLAMGQWLAWQHTPSEAAPEFVKAAQVAGKADAFRLSAILGLCMGVFCFFLPHTPPMEGARRSATLEAIRETRRQPLLTLFLLAVPVSCIHQFYFVHTEGFLTVQQLSAPSMFQTLFGVGGGGLMTIGQMSEVAVLALIPLFAHKVSRKGFLALGLAAYASRMALFAYVDVLPFPEMFTLMLGIAMHGLCYGAFIFVAFMIVDEETSADVRASAQNLFNLVIIGIGIIVGSKIAGYVYDGSVVGSDAAGQDIVDYTHLFAVPMWAALGCLVALLVFYPGRR